MHKYTILIMALLASVLATAAVFAQELVADTMVSGEPWIDLFLPFVSTVTVSLIGVFVTFGTVYLKNRWGIEIDEENRKAFQTSVTNAAGLLIQNAATAGRAIEFDVRSPMMKQAIDYVARGAPAAFARQEINPEHVAEAVTSKVAQILAGALPPAAAPSTPIET